MDIIDTITVMVNESTKEGKKIIRRPFSPFSFENALIIAMTIQEKNAGKPMNRLLLADAIGRKPTSSDFRDLLSSSYKYGLTEGTEKAEYISLTDIGNKVTHPINEEEQMKAKQQACLSQELFKKIYYHYRNGKFPTTGSFFENTLEREFSVPREYVKQLIDLLEKNGKYAGILRNISGSQMVMFDNFTQSEKTNVSEEEYQDTPIEEEEIEKSDKLEKKQPDLNKSRPIFIAHGKNKKPLEQLIKILQEFQLEYRVAVNEPHSGRPISQKIRDLMQECGSAIFIFSKEGEETTETGETMPNLNVVFELGAASVLYGEKVVIFKEEGLKFSSDFNDLGHISFEADKLDAQAMHLLKELIAMGFLKLTSA